MTQRQATPKKTPTQPATREHELSRTTPPPMPDGALCAWWKRSTELRDRFQGEAEFLVFAGRLRAQFKRDKRLRVGFLDVDDFLAYSLAELTGRVSYGPAGENAAPRARRAAQGAVSLAAPDPNWQLPFGPPRGSWREIAASWRALAAVLGRSAPQRRRGLTPKECATLLKQSLAGLEKSFPERPDTAVRYALEAGILFERLRAGRERAAGGRLRRGKCMAEGPRSAAMVADLRGKGMNKTEAVEVAAKELSVSRSTVWRHVRRALSIASK